jgi:hypothetical protein
MRTWITLMENLRKVPTPAELSAAIASTVVEYLKRKHSPNVYEINNGFCEAFAYDVIHCFIDQETTKFYSVWADELTEVGEDGFAASEAWDVPLINRLLPNSHPTHGLTWEEAALEIPSHCWLVLNGRSYDAECPQGVDNFFELPLIARGMAEFAKHKASP